MMLHRDKGDGIVLFAGAAVLLISLSPIFSIYLCILGFCFDFYCKITLII
jgi:hypothetical protein